MNAALRLSWYKFKHHYMDFVKVLLGIVAFEGLILYIQDKGFLKDFETTRMTLFLLLFSTSLLIVVQNSIYISKERSVLNRDFFSGLSRSAFALAVWGFTPSLLFWKLLSLSYLTRSLVSSLTRSFQTLVIFLVPTVGKLGLQCFWFSWRRILLPSLSQPWLANLRLPLLS